ncbi:MAG: hypothetical protein OXC40_05640, partial [Proteobacteria bacterium]|nr:hypothetical protein [Pseudomonadota bacterium]
MLPLTLLFIFITGENIMKQLSIILAMLLMTSCVFNEDTSKKVSDRDLETRAVAPQQNNNNQNTRATNTDKQVGISAIRPAAIDESIGLSASNGPSTSTNDNIDTFDGDGEDAIHYQEKQL